MQLYVSFKGEGQVKQPKLIYESSLELPEDAGCGI